MTNTMRLFLFVSLMALALATLLPVFVPSWFSTDKPKAQPWGNDPRMPAYWRKYLDSYDDEGDLDPNGLANK